MLEDALCVLGKNPLCSLTVLNYRKRPKPPAACLFVQDLEWAEGKQDESREKGWEYREQKRQNDDDEDESKIEFSSQ